MTLPDAGLIQSTSILDSRRANLHCSCRDLRVGMERWSGLLRGRNILIAIAAFALGSFGAVVWFREPTQPLTRDALDAARQRWRDSDVRSYEARYRMNGSLCEVRVRDGIVEDLTVDGRMSNTADVRSYSIDGLFGLLDLEITNLNDPTGPFGKNAPSMIARVRFNAQLGYPERYVRSGGTGRNASIEMVAFRSLPNQGDETRIPSSP